MQTCYRHSNRETGVSCSNCGRPICPDCMTPTPVGMRCPECSKEKTQVKTLSSMASAPNVTMALIAINVIAFLASGQFGTGGSAQNTQIFDKGGLFGPDIHDKHEYWRLVTSGFLHAGFLHIAFNMYLLYVLGQMLEPVLGNVKFAVIYGVALLAGSFGALVLSPHSFTVGASGAVFGLMGAAFFELRSRGMDAFAGGIGSIGGLILFNLVFSFALSNISIGGHIGGLIGGSLVTLAMHEADRRRRPLLGYAAALAIAAIAVVGAIAVSQSAVDVFNGGGFG
jgi:membrane associated rhomboid family serine protease